MGPNQITAWSSRMTRSTRSRLPSPLKTGKRCRQTWQICSVKLARAQEVEAFPADSDGRRVRRLSLARMAFLSSLSDRRVRRLRPTRTAFAMDWSRRKAGIKPYNRKVARLAAVRGEAESAVAT